jgi:hypothetical protein
VPRQHVYDSYAPHGMILGCYKKKGRNDYGDLTGPALNIYINIYILVNSSTLQSTNTQTLISAAAY